jgi:hypothetical protein
LFFLKKKKEKTEHKFSSPNPAYIRPGRSFFFSQSGVNPGWDQQSPNRRIRTHQTKNTKTQNGKKFNTPKQQQVAGNKTRKKKKKKKKTNLPAIKPNRPLNHSPEIIKPKQENQSIWIWISTSPAVILWTPAPSSTMDLSAIGLPLPSPSV